METTSQDSHRTSNKISVFTALAGMLIMFLAGVFIGLHPKWIPIKTGGEDYGLPAKMAALKPDASDTTPTTVPSSQPTTTNQ